jgi:hypothetical protein
VRGLFQGAARLQQFSLEVPCEGVALAEAAAQRGGKAAVDPPRAEVFKSQHCSEGILPEIPSWPAELEGRLEDLPVLDGSLSQAQAFWVDDQHYL